MVWRDARGTTRFATVVTKNVSEQGAFVECLSGAPIPLYRLVYLQLERTARSSCDLPECLRQGKVLSAIYRVGATTPKTGTPHGYALRLLIEPRRLSHAQRGAEDEGHSATA